MKHIRNIIYSISSQLFFLFFFLLLSYLSENLLTSSCEIFQLGYITSYKCPIWHPHTWLPYLAIIGFFTGPILVNFIYYKIKKRKLYSYKFAIISAIIQAALIYSTTTANNSYIGPL